MQCNVPVTFLTATLPDRLYSTLVSQCRIPANHKLIRAPADRKEHRYVVIEVKDNLVRRTVAFIKASAEKIKGTSRGIVFVRSKKDGSELQEHLPGVDLMTGDVKEENIRKLMIQRWKTGQSGGWIIGTSSLIQGVDYPEVDLVVFMQPPWGMVDFVQGAGRAGRSGKLSQVVLLHMGQSSYPHLPDDLDLICGAEMGNWLKSTGVCRRLGISECMDKAKTTCQLLDGAAKCDVCLPDPAINEILNASLPSPCDQHAVALPQPLAPPTNRKTQPQAQLPVPALRPQPAPPNVTRTSTKERDLLEARNATMRDCISKLKVLGDTCVVCHAVTRGRSTKKSHTMCFNQATDKRLKRFYDWNKPSHRITGPVRDQLIVKL